eukprot:1283864-Pleurochrysis_carterae.AAC.2
MSAGAASVRSSDGSSSYPPPPVHPTDDARVAALRDAQVLDTPYHPSFDNLTAIAADTYKTPICLVSLIDKERQWFKSNRGLPGVPETPRDISFCTYAVQPDSPDVFVVPDATQDPRFVNNPLVTGDPNIRFYAGAPITFNHQRVGTVCIIDREPRPQAANENFSQLTKLAQMASSLFEISSVMQPSRNLISMNAKSHEETARLRDERDHLMRSSREVQGHLKEEMHSLQTQMTKMMTELNERDKLVSSMDTQLKQLYTLKAPAASQDGIISYSKWVNVLRVDAKDGMQVAYIRFKDMPRVLQAALKQGNEVGQRLHSVDPTEGATALRKLFVTDPSSAPTGNVANEAIMFLTTYVWSWHDPRCVVVRPGQNMPVALGDMCIVNWIHLV